MPRECKLQVLFASDNLDNIFLNLIVTLGAKYFKTDLLTLLR